MISLQLLPAVLVQVVGRGGVHPRAVEGEAEGLNLILHGVAEFHGLGEFGAGCVLSTVAQGRHKYTLFFCYCQRATEGYTLNKAIYELFAK
ncbi:MAG: hypothetical protein R3D00_14540 [Bacteroidia bacterium]